MLTIGDPAVTPSWRHRLEVRVTPEQDALIRQGGRSRAHDRHRLRARHRHDQGQGVIKQHRDLVLSNEAFDRLIAELDKPAEPVPELVELFKKKARLRDE